MSNVQWIDNDRCLETILTKYQNAISLASGNLTKVIRTFKFILSHADFFIFLGSESQDRRLLLEGYEVWGLAQEIINQATGVCDFMQDMYKETQGGLIRVKEMQDALAGDYSSYPRDLASLVRGIGEVREVVQRIRVHTEDLLSAMAAILAQANVLQKRVAAIPGYTGYPICQDKRERQKPPCFSRPEPASGRERNLYPLIFPSPKKIMEN